MCMNVTAKYIQIHSNMHRTKCAYLNVYKHKIQSHTNRYAPQKPVHICRYVTSKYIQIHADMHLYIGAYLTVSCCMNTAISKHTYTYARDTDHKRTQYILIHSHTCRYWSVHITYAPCISDMHLDVCCAYLSLYVYVFFLHTYHIKRRGHPDTRRPREGEAGGARVGLSRWRRARPVGSASRPAAQSWSA